MELIKRILLENDEDLFQPRRLDGRLFKYMNQNDVHAVKSTWNEFTYFYLVKAHSKESANIRLSSFLYYKYLEANNIKRYYEEYIIDLTENDFTTYNNWILKHMQILDNFIRKSKEICLLFRTR